MSRLLHKLTKSFKRLVLRDEFLRAHKAWRKVMGDQTLRLEYDLNRDSVVFDGGGYLGNFAATIHERFGCTVYIFEPSAKHFETCRARFEDNDHIIPVQCALLDTDGQMHLTDEGEGGSLFGDANDDDELIETRRIGEEMARLGVAQIDLLKLNIEGGEYRLLQSMLDEGLMDKVHYLQVQFHEFIPDAKALRTKIRTDLAKTHEQQWCYPFVWESWKRRDAKS